jgi:hypothetical protein
MNQPKKTSSVDRVRVLGEAAAPIRKKPRQGHRAAQSFSAAEIDVMVQILATLTRGGDPSQLLRSQAARDVNSKFIRMKKKIDER